MAGSEMTELSLFDDYDEPALTPAPPVQLALFGDDTDIAPLVPNRRLWRPLQQPLAEKTVARFWKKVVKTPTHWWWRSAVSFPDGYGRFTFTDGDTPRTLSAHRFALLLAHGDLGDGIVGEHDCDETLCVRVEDGHLKLGTQSANLAHAVAMGRHIGPTPAGGDPRGRYGRAVAIRDALKHGYDPELLHAALAGHSIAGDAAPTLF
ncbi:hypothetical protein HQ346_16680 [Rhodococcus sp. BP-252]|uniref:hypothetical protein n=1 Tax=unclassified Rhodococcus (in: high G+C Gram-positive bacteria) TaxID=192944 RepID=UPI001C9B9552|nr:MULTISPECIES: hypothetical protein [unclassified Rhodococcus (in: high G+C Gram-positive bacteria)]MBY6413332.1 hypothetical protein [Rhodococcus sp. BP-320]MBY6418064.1 hypothetical protein [Rhodococcus sp. BP-321]MBY6422246.1 hypothetical protein [Rhodococcus sp. BP-324]MBY6428113.1 hypothetical protein [Rhodococcus sp. BP-323]MBY6433253.1 hypothetical protein [Rhodococcus sp. BP-322]